MEFQHFVVKYLYSEKVENKRVFLRIKCVSGQVCEDGPEHLMKNGWMVYEQETLFHFIPAAIP
jgi:hypothetical protein